MDDTATLLALADRMLWTAALAAVPVLAANLAVGLVVGIIQAATSVNEQTLTFVPKLAVRRRESSSTRISPARRL